MHHYLSMAKRILEDGYFNETEQSLKKFFYMFRALFCAKWIYEKRCQPKTSMPEMMDQGILPSWVEDDVRELIRVKSAMIESESKEISPKLLDWCTTSYSELSANFVELKHSPTKSIDELDDWFYRICLAK